MVGDEATVGKEEGFLGGCFKTAIHLKVLKNLWH